MNHVQDDHTDPQGLLNRYILDYMKRNDMHESAKIFAREANVIPDPVEFRSPPGFLRQWWDIFIDFYMTTTQGRRVVDQEGSSSSSGSRPYETAEDSNFSVAPSGSGKNKSVEPTASAVAGSVSPAMPPTANQVQQFLASSSGEETASAPGSSGHVQSPLTGSPLAGAGSGSPTTASHGLDALIPTQNQTQLDPSAEVFGQASRDVGNPMNVDDESSGKEIVQSVEQQVSAPEQQTAQRKPMLKLNIENLRAFMSQNDQTSTVFLPSAGLHSSSSDKSEQQGLSLSEVRSFHGFPDKLTCCNFSSNGKLLAFAGDKKVMIWNLETSATDIMEHHFSLITDVRFRPDSTIFATSSYDRSVQIWDASRPSRPLFRLTGHSEDVISIDFHPTKVDLLCSCDSNNEIRLWNINQKLATVTLEGGNRQVRFQPGPGKLMAAASENFINLFDVETNTIVHRLEGHEKEVRAICWDVTGTYIGSVSEDSARIWSISSLGGNCIHGLHSSGKKFESCTFHPGYLQHLVIGSDQSLELWIDNNKTLTYPAAHNDLISSLDASPQSAVIASASHDKVIKIWK